MAHVRFRATLGGTLAALAAANVLAHRVPAASVLIGVGLTGTLAAVARAGRLTAADLGLARRSWPSGVRWGGACAAVVATGYGVAMLVPAARGLVTGAGPGWGPTLLAALVVIPLGTVIPEEFAFRGVLWGLLRRRCGPRVATLVSSGLFGLWHVAPALAAGPANDAMSAVVGSGPLGVAVRVIATVGFTGAAGVLLCEVRARSNSLLAPIALHGAVNGIGQIVVQLA
jgi:membrane protease YdiL (CAAX protease family)